MYKANIRLKVTCPRHKRYNPDKDGLGGVKGGCRTCFAIHEISSCIARVKTLLEQISVRNDQLLLDHTRQ